MARRTKQQVADGVCGKGLHPWVEGQKQCAPCVKTLKASAKVSPNYEVTVFDPNNPLPERYFYPKLSNGLTSAEPFVAGHYGGAHGSNCGHCNQWKQLKRARAYWEAQRLLAEVYEEDGVHLSVEDDDY